MIITTHSSGTRKILIVCDSDLIGKKFEEGNKQLDLTSEFYQGEEMSEEQLTPIIKTAYSIQFVGEESVALAVKLGIVEEEKIIKIQNIPIVETLQA